MIRVLGDKAFSGNRHVAASEHSYLPRHLCNMPSPDMGEVRRQVNPTVSIAGPEQRVGSMAGKGSQRSHRPRRAEILRIAEIHRFPVKPIARRRSIINTLASPSSGLRKGSDKLLGQLNDRTRHRLYLVNKLLISEFTETQQHNCRARQWAFDNCRHFQHQRGGIGVIDTGARTVSSDFRQLSRAVLSSALAQLAIKVFNNSRSGHRHGDNHGTDRQCD